MRLFPYQDSLGYVTSHWVSCGILALIRTILALFALATLTASIINAAKGKEGVIWLFYYTELSYVGFTAYFIVFPSILLSIFIIIR